MRKVLEWTFINNLRKKRDVQTCRTTRSLLLLLLVVVVAVVVHVDVVAIAGGHLAGGPGCRKRLSLRERRLHLHHLRPSG